MFYENLPDTLIFLRVIYLLAQYLLTDPREQVEATTASLKFEFRRAPADPREQVEATTIPIESRIDDTLADPREQVEATTASLKFESRRAP